MRNRKLEKPHLKILRLLGQEGAYCPSVPSWQRIDVLIPPHFRRCVSAMAFVELWEHGYLDERYNDRIGKYYVLSEKGRNTPTKEAQNDNDKR